MKATDILQTHELKKTNSRLALIKALQESTLPQSENEVKTRMSDQYDRITFYRNVQALEDAGIIHRIVVNSHTVKYALNCCEAENNHQHIHKHVHFNCNRCGKTFCLENIEVKDYSLPTEFQMEECEVLIKGNCKFCSQK
jgi:Fur family transcriptional regulator, ferric uptake regulator